MTPPREDALADVRRQVGTLATIAYVRADRCDDRARRARRAGLHAVTTSLSALEADAALLRTAAEVLGDYHTLLGSLLAARAGAAVDLLHAAGEPGLVV